MSTRAAEAAFKRAQSRHSKSGNQCHHFTYHRLTCDQYDGLLARAGGLCEMCKTAESETGGQRLVVDHFQSNQARIRVVRGMVCDACNSAMSCLDGNKRWGPRRGVLEPQARMYQARVLRDLPLAELGAIERIQEQRQMRIARPPQQEISKGRADERQPGDQRGADRMSAYQDLMTALVARRPDQSAAEDERIVQAALAKHAHELAERQRKAIEGFDLDDHWAVYYRVSDVESLPDLIDPHLSAGPVRPDEEAT
jgi:hypothetical protein